MPNIKSQLRYKGRIYEIIAVISFFCYIANFKAQTPVSEHQKALIKVSFIYKFTNYIFWPNEDLMTEFRICVMSSDALRKRLDELPERVKFRNRLPIKILHCKSVDDISDCHMLIVDGSDNKDLWSAYSKIRGKRVLMIAEDLLDFKKSMVSFTESNGAIKFIVNKTKLDESKLATNQRLFELAIVKEGEWNSLFEKFRSLVKSNDREVLVEKSELSQMLNMYSNLEKEKQSRESIIAKLEDTMKARIMLFNQKMEEYNKLNDNINDQKKVLNGQMEKIDKQRAQILNLGTEITRQKNVILLIAILSAIGIILLVLALTVNNQRRKANRILAKQKSEIEAQKNLVDTKQKEILDSINYAKRIQTAMMGSKKLMDDNLPEYFIMFKPKDIVAGDFYWASMIEDNFVYITADCTGHGVPGAFMSLLNISKLNEAVNQKKISSPDLVLNYVKREIINSLNPEGSSEISKDGMDAVLCKLDRKNLKLQYAAANGNLCIIRDGMIMSYKGDKMPVGKSHDDNAEFTFNEIALNKGDLIYTYSDGYSDQFGGPRGKKLKHRNLKETLALLAHLPIEEQREALVNKFNHWMGTLEQVDDVLIIGIRV